MYTHSLKSMRNLSSTSKMRQNEEKINITSNDRISYEMYPIEILKCHKRTHVIQIGECVPCRYSWSLSFVVFVCFFLFLSMWIETSIISFGATLCPSIECTFSISDRNVCVCFVVTIGMHRQKKICIVCDSPHLISFVLFLSFFSFRWVRSCGIVYVEHTGTCCCFYACISCRIATSGSKSKNNF